MFGSVKTNLPRLMGTVTDWGFACGYYSKICCVDFNLNSYDDFSFT